MAITLDTLRNSENRTRNTAVSAAVAGAAGAVGGYMAYSPLKNGEIKDSFIPSAMKNIWKTKGHTQKETKFIKDFMKLGNKYKGIDGVADMTGVPDAKEVISYYFEKGKLKENTEYMSDTATNTVNGIKSAIKENKLKTAAIAGAIFALIGGGAAFVLSNKNKSQDETKLDKNA